jgi:hypothetical protein
VNVGPTLKAYAKRTKVVEPRVSTLDHPAKFAETTAVLGAAPCDHRLDAALAKFLAMCFGVVAAIGVDDLGLLKWPAAYTANRRNGVNGRSNWVTSLRFAPVRIALMGTAFASTRR